MNKLATDEEVVAIGQRGENPFPKFKAMCDLVDRAYSSDGYFQHCATGWAAFNGYAHSGLEQLGRRYTDSDVMPNYSDEEIGGLLGTSASLSLSLLVPYFRQIGCDDKAAVLERLLEAHTDDDSH